VSGLAPTDAAVTVDQLRAWVRHTELRLRSARTMLERDRLELAALSRSERRARGGAQLVGRIETNGAIVAQLDVTLVALREQLGMDEADPERQVRVEDLTGCECERRPSDGGLVEVVWSRSCPLHGFGASR
jgi:hypothetical protein